MPPVLIVEGYRFADNAIANNQEKIIAEAELLSDQLDVSSKIDRERHHVLSNPVNIIASVQDCGTKDKPLSKGKRQKIAD